jgi:hypothetical protein
MFPATTARKEERRVAGLKDVGTVAGLVAVGLSLLAMGRAPYPDRSNLLLTGGAILALVLSRTISSRRS